MWGRPRESRPEEAVDLDEQIRRLRAVIAAPNRPPDAVGSLIALLTVRALIASREEREDAALEDRRAAAGLLRAYDGQPSPVERRTELLVRMGLVASERATGDLAGALSASEWTIANLGDVGPEDRELCTAFSADLERLRSELAAAKRRPEALRSAELSSDLAVRLAAHDEATFVPLVGIAWTNEAAARASTGDLDGARALNDEAIALFERHAPTAPALRTALSNRAHLQRRNGEWTEAVDTERLVLAAVRAETAPSPEEVSRLNSLFLTLVRSGRREEAEQTVGEAIALARVLVEADSQQETLLATLLGNQANIRGELERFEDAWTSSSEALAIRERRAAEHPSRESDRGLAMILNNHAVVLRRLGRVVEAADAAARSVEVRRRLAADGEPSSTALLANSLNSHAEQLGHLGDPERAVLLAEEARDLFDSLPPPGAAIKLRRANQETLGRVLALAGRHDEALLAAECAVALGRQAVAEAPGEDRELASCLDSLAERLAGAGRGDQAESARAEATKLRAASDT